MRDDMKTLIADTFSQMLDKEDIDKITVTKLIAECHISRQTFYYHFKDIMDVLEWTFRRATQELVQKSLNEEDRLGALTTYVAFVRQGVPVNFLESTILSDLILPTFTTSIISPCFSR